MRRCSHIVNSFGAALEGWHQLCRLFAHQCFSDGRSLGLRCQPGHSFGYRSHHPIEIIAVLLHVSHRNAERVKRLLDFLRGIGAILQDLAYIVVQPDQRALKLLHADAGLRKTIIKLLQMFGR